MRGRRFILAAFLAWLCLLADSAESLAQLRIVTYNTNNFSSGETLPRAGMATVLEALGNQAKAGFARPIDILVLEEQSTLTTSTQAYVDLLNGIYGPGTYARGLLQGSTTGGGRPAVVYNTRSVQLVAESQASTASSSGGPRATLRYEFRPVGYDAAADFYVYASHFKAVDDAASAERRGIEAAEIRADADALGEGTLAIYAGDFNFYRSSDAGFQTLLSPGPGQAFDPLDRIGNWNNASSFRDVHTQSPVTSAVFPGQVTGGLDDRFDFQLVTGELLDDAGFDIIPGSYWAFGNTGTHSLNGPLSSGSTSALQALLPGYTAGQAGGVIDALMAASDHLPVVADYRLPARMTVLPSSLPAAVLRDAVVGGSFTVSNTAPVAVAAGADSLGYAISGTGDVVASGAGSRTPLSASATHAFVFDTSAAGLRTGVLAVDATSAQAAGASFRESYAIEVVDRALLSSTNGTGGGGGSGGGEGGGGTSGEATPFSGSFTFGSDGAVTAFAYNGEPLAGVTVGDLLKVGITNSSSGGNFRGSAWPTGATNGNDAFSGDLDLGRYIEFTLTTAAAGTLELDSLEFGLGRSGTGPRQWQWRSSADDYAAALTGYGMIGDGLVESAGIITSPDQNTSWAGNRLDLGGNPALQGLETVTLRLYGSNAEGSAGTGGLQGPLTFSGSFIAAGSPEPPPVDPPVDPPGGSIGAGGLIAVSNAAADAGTQRAAAAIVMRSLAGDTGWSVSGLDVGETIASGQTMNGTAVFDPTGRLNGPATGSFQLMFEHADQALPGAAAADLGSLSWTLETTVTGRSGSGTAVVAAGGSFAGLGLDSDAALATTAMLAAGDATVTRSVTMAFESPPVTGLFASDVLTLAGIGGDPVVLSLTYDPLAVNGRPASDLSLGWLDDRSGSGGTAAWVNAVAGNTASVVSLAEPFAGSWTEYTQAFSVTAVADAVGAWGIDEVSREAWAVIDHASQFAVIASTPAPKPGDANLDGQVDVFDLIMVNSGGKYGTGLVSVWSEGDFNADGVTNVFDLVTVNVGGAYGQGAGAAVAVPEPALAMPWVAVGIGLAFMAVRGRAAWPSASGSEAFHTGG